MDASDPKGVPGDRVLIVDDDPTMLVLARAASESVGLSVQESSNGRDALECFRSAPPDLILLDVVMPEMNGFAACRAIRELPEGKHVPILIMTGLDDLRSIQQAYQAGATDFVTKPIEWTVLGQRALYLIRAGAALRDLHEARVAAEAAERVKTAFLRNMSHEIRTPMTAILGWIELLLDENCSPAAAEPLRVVQRTGRHLLALLDSILDLSRLHAGELRTERREVSLCGLVDGLIELLRPQAAARGLGFEVCYGEGLPERVLTDPQRLRQILLNLLGNALKFTERGWVRLTVEPEGVRENGDHGLRFAVEDTGVGLGEGDVDRLFQAFAQADDSTTRRFGGSGLGLAISRGIARLLGGDVRAERCPVGSRFVLSIAAAAAPESGPALVAEPVQVVPASSGATGCALLAEDSPDNRQLISTILRRAGWQIDLARDGNECVQKALAAREAGAPYDVILMDLEMPELDGLEATRRLRRADYTGPIVALTAHVLPADERGCLSAGCDAFQRKPIEREKLLELMSGFIAKHQAPDAG